MVSVYADGSAEPMPGFGGGWAFIVVSDEVELARGSGGVKSTTNNVMELTAALSGLEHVLLSGAHKTCHVELVSDSRLALTIADGSVAAHRYGPVAEALRAAGLEAAAATRWVRGHAGHRWNEAVDALASLERQAQLPAKVRRRRQAKARR